MRKPYILMSLLVLSTLLSACSTVSGSPASQSAPAPDEVLATSIGTYENRTLLVPDGRLALTALHKGKDYQGKPMFYVLFELTNTTEKTQNIQLMIQSFMEVSQTVHGKAQNLQYAVLTDSPFQDKLDRLADEINPGETTQGAYPYEFINENKPVHFKFRDRLLSLDEPIASEEITITEKSLVR